jgi:histidinol-phosphate aminotransferase
MSLFRENIEAMRAYVPGEQPADAGRVIKLNTNENPYPPSPRVGEALRDVAAGALRLYPDATGRAFRVAAGEALGLDAESMLVGNGSDDVIAMIARACLAPGRTCAYPVPTFEFYHTQARIEDARIVEVPLAEDLSLDVEALIEARGDVTFVANPNSPTGIEADLEQLDRLASALEGLVVVDEAYVDFAEGSAVGLVAERDNVVVLRTLSKGYCLAGLRLGFAIAGPRVLEGLAKTKAIYNVGVLASHLGAIAIADQAYKNACARRIVNTRERLAGVLRERGCEVWPSRTNFLLVRPPGGDAAGVADSLKRRGVLVRYYDKPRLSDKLRVSMPSEGDLPVVVEAFDAALGGG